MMDNTQDAMQRWGSRWLRLLHFLCWGCIAPCPWGSEVRLSHLKSKVHKSINPNLLKLWCRKQSTGLLPALSLVTAWPWAAHFIFPTFQHWSVHGIFRTWEPLKSHVQCQVKQGLHPGITIIQSSKGTGTASTESQCSTSMLLLQPIRQQWRMQGRSHLCGRSQRQKHTAALAPDIPGKEDHICKQHSPVFSWSL